LVLKSNVSCLVEKPMLVEMILLTTSLLENGLMYLSNLIIIEPLNIL